MLPWQGIENSAVETLHGPLNAIRIGSYVWGRGALDMKGMGVMELMTMLMLKRRNVDLARDVILMCNCDEEIGSGSSRRLTLR